MTHFSITAISDNVCPFCYLGIARLNRAIGLYKRTVPSGSNDTFAISWHAFQLDPTAKPGFGESRPTREVTAAKFGAQRVAALEERLASMGAAEGIRFTMAGRIGSTRDSHRVVQLGKTKGSEVENAVVHEVMKMYFEEGGDITSWDDLVAAAQKAGVDAAETREWLESGRGGDEVDREVEESVTMGVRGVPKFIINKKFQIDGAEDVQNMLGQLTAAKKHAN